MAPVSERGEEVKEENKGGDNISDSKRGSKFIDEETAS